MDEDNGQKPPAMISQEGPLRRITPPSFAGPVAFRNSGSFAQTPATAITVSTSGSADAASSSRLPTGAPVGGSSTSGSFRQAPTTAASQPSTNHPLATSSPVQRPSLSAAHQQSVVDTFSSLGRAPQPQPAQQVPAVQHPPAQPVPSDAQDLFARPSPLQQPPLGSDPLSHLLRDAVEMAPDSVGGIVRGNNISQEQHTGGVGLGAAEAFEYGKVSQPGWGSSSEKAAPAPPTKSTPQQMRGMPALPPPPQGYSASRYQTSPPSYQQNHQQGVPVAAAVLPPPAATAVNQALPMLSPPKERSIDDLVNEFLANSAPPPPEPTDQDSAMADPQGWVAALGRLAGRRAWSTLVDVAGTMLVVHRGGGAPGLTAEQAMNVRLRRALGLLRLGRGVEAVEAATEAREEGRQTKLAPVSVAARLAAAGARATCDGAAELDAVDELTTLKLELEGLIATAAASSTPPSQHAPDGTSGRPLPLTIEQASIWRRRVISTLANVFVARGNWRLALGLLETMGEEAEETNAKGVGGRGAGSCRVEVLSRIGRVFLQFGALKDAEVYFRRAEEAVLAEGDAGNKDHVGDNARILVNRGLLLLSKNDFVSAQENFEEAAAVAAAALSAKQKQPQNTDDDWDWATSGEGTGLLGSALNNLSLAMVYSCDVMRGVRTLEELIRTNPCLYMLDVVVFNLCTLYDLSFDAVASATKKRTLQAVGQRFRLEDIDPASFRIS